MKVFCIISDERAFRSQSPPMFTAILKRAGIMGTYVPFNVCSSDVGQAIQSIRILHIAGANVTVPYKEAVIPFLDTLSEGARIIGAVNTIVRKGDELKGYNTNAIGFMDALNHAGFNVSGKSAIVEYIDNEIIIIYNHESFQVATNFIITGSGVPEVFPCNRYKTAYNSLKAVNGIIDKKQAMNILQSIAQSRGKSKTIWSAVYNLSNLTLRIAAGRNYFKIFKLGMN